MERDERHKIIWDFQREIAKIYKEYELTNLSGLDMEFMLNGRQIFAWFIDTVNAGQKWFPNFDFFNLFDDLIVCTDEILHFTAQLYLYRPYLQDPIAEAYIFAGKPLYPITDTIEVKRYNIYSNSLCEKVYNYWDRIGDLIATYFPDLFDPKKVYFGTTIDKIPLEFQESENYKWLKSFKETDYADINKRRIEIVHYTSLGTTHKRQHIKDPFNRQQIEKLIEERNSRPEYFKRHIKLTQDGFERTVLLIDEITKKRLSEAAAHSDVLVSGGGSVSSESQ